MRARLTPLCSLIVLAVAGSLPAHAATLIDNANGYTLNTKGDLVQFTALAFDDAGRIIAVGASADVAAKAPQAKRIDMGGRTLLPGLIDAHGHVFGLGQQLTQLDLFNSTSLAGALKSIGEYAGQRRAVE
ncbi:MAG: amidohydrolase, partial [Oxalobacteraceae bacterium]